jgi:RNA polymerase sigma factor for flagellar operon FliA
MLSDKNRSLHPELKDKALDYYPFIRQVARRIARRLPANVALDDIVSAGFIGLMDCIDKYDPSKSSRFEKYAEFRIKGAILDELRAADHLSRDQRANVNALRQAQKRLEVRNGRAPELEEVAAELGCDLDRYHATFARFAASCNVSLDESLDGEEADEECGLDARSHLHAVLAQALGELPVRLRLIIKLYYFEDMNLKEIGRVLGLTESRICQLHGQAMKALRTALEGI